MKLPATKLAAVLYIAGTFLIGALAGGVLGYQQGRRPIFRPPDREAIRAHICADLTSKLGLTPEQRQQLDPIVRQNMEDFDAERRAGMERMGERMKQSNQRIRAILTPEQQAKFDELEKARWKDHEKRHDRSRPKAALGGPFLAEAGDPAQPKEFCQDSRKAFPATSLPPRGPN